MPITIGYITYTQNGTTSTAFVSSSAGNIGGDVEILCTVTSIGDQLRFKIALV
jgi:hypothetical protein